jgi:hypothetical protein
MPYRHPIVGYVTNFGYCYCTAHGVEQPGMLGTKTSKNVPHAVTDILRDGCNGMTCDTCGITLPQYTSKDYERYSLSMHAELLAR